MRSIGLVILGAGVVAASAALWSAAPQRSVGRCTIGFITPLSGARASIGRDARAGAELALADSDPDDARRLDLRFEDSSGDPARGVAAFHALTAQGAAAVITQNSNVSLPIQPLANSLHIVQLAVTTTSDRYTTPPDYSFRLNGSTAAEARLMAEVLERDHGAAPLIAFMHDEYPEMLHRHLLDELLARGIEPAADQDFMPGDTDLRAVIGRLRERGGGPVVCLGYQVQCGLLVKQAREAGLTPSLILVNTPVNNREFFEVAGAAAEGVRVSYLRADVSGLIAQRYAARQGREMSVFAANAYDAVMLLTGAAKRCAADPGSDCLRAALQRSGALHGASGEKMFDANGDMHDSYELLVARGGRFVRE